MEKRRGGEKFFNPVTTSSTLPLISSTSTAGSAQVLGSVFLTFSQLLDQALKQGGKKKITEPCPPSKWFPAPDCKVANYSGADSISRTLLTLLALAARGLPET